MSTKQAHPDSRQLLHMLYGTDSAFGSSLGRGETPVHLLDNLAGIIPWQNRFVKHEQHPTAMKNTRRMEEVQALRGRG
jgi:hypothetical protein